MENFTLLQTDLQDGILIVTICREDKLNALNKTVISELDTVMDEVYNDSAIKGVIITGKGNKAFVAGADIGEFTGLNKEQAEALARRGHDVFHKIDRCPKPIIAAVNGFALGGGCELAMACHLRIASENAKFGQPEVNLGLIPGYGGTQRLVHLIGKGKALELLMTADIIDATCAQKLGLVNEVVQTVELLATCKAILNKIISKAPVAIDKVIDAVYAHFTDGIDGFETEIKLFADCVETQDFKEGVAAFLEKRKPSFKGN